MQNIVNEKQTKEKQTNKQTAIANKDNKHKKYRYDLQQWIYMLSSQ